MRSTCARSSRSAASRPTSSRGSTRRCTGSSASGPIRSCIGCKSLALKEFTARRAIAGRFALVVQNADGTRRASRNFPCRAGEQTMSVGTIILIILIIALLGGFSGIGGGPFYGPRHYGGGGPRLLHLPFPLLLVVG